MPLAMPLIQTQTRQSTRTSQEHRVIHWMSSTAESQYKWHQNNSTNKC